MKAQLCIHSFSAGTLNQGWWASNSPNTNQNDNHITGPYNGNEYRSFYTFDLSNMTGTVKSASLLVKNGSQPGPVTLGLWDVTTAASMSTTTTAWTRPYLPTSDPANRMGAI